VPECKKSRHGGNLTFTSSWVFSARCWMGAEAEAKAQNMARTSKTKGRGIFFDMAISWHKGLERSGGVELPYVMGLISRAREKGEREREK
jgi:hypothetical protein